MPLPEKPPLFDFNEKKVKQYAKNHFDDYDSALKYLFFVITEMENVYDTIMKKFDIAHARFEERYGANDFDWPREKFSEVMKIAAPLGDLDDFNLGIRDWIIKLERERLQGVSFDQSITLDAKNTYSHYRFRKIKWCDIPYTSLLGLIDLLETAGLIPRDSYKYAGAIARNHFAHPDGSPIARKGFNNEKGYYEANKYETIDDLMDRLRKASETITPPI